MKFTEEQYQKIVEAFEKVNNEYNMGFINHNVVRQFQEKIYEEFRYVMHFVDDWQAITAIANPLTREWAHEQYVEKEKRYVWTSKKRTNGGYVHRLFKSTYDGVLLATVSPEAEIVEEEYLTESEIREWGFDPERFDKEEVE